MTNLGGHRWLASTILLLFLTLPIHADQLWKTDCNTCIKAWRFNFDNVCGFKKPATKLGKILSKGKKVSVKDIADGELASCIALYLNIGLICTKPCGEFRLSPKPDEENYVELTVEPYVEEYLNSLSDFGQTIDRLGESMVKMEAETERVHNERDRAVEEQRPLLEGELERQRQLAEQLKKWQAIQNIKQQLANLMRPEFSGANEITPPATGSEHNVAQPSPRPEQPEFELNPDTDAVILDVDGAKLILD